MKSKPLSKKWFNYVGYVLRAFFFGDGCKLGGNNMYHKNFLGQARLAWWVNCFITQLNYFCVQKLIILKWQVVMEKYWSLQELNPGPKGHEPDTTITTLAYIEVIVFRWQLVQNGNYQPWETVPCNEIDWV